MHSLTRCSLLTVAALFGAVAPTIAQAQTQATPSANAAPGRYAPPAVTTTKGGNIIVKSIDPKTGQVTYSDRFLEDTTGATQYQIKSYGTSAEPLSPVPSKEEGKKGDGALVKWAKDQEAKAAENEKLAKEQAEKQTRETCNRARQNLAILTSGAKVVRPDSRGEVVYLTDEQVQKERATAEADIARTCNAPAS